MLISVPVGEPQIRQQLHEKFQLTPALAGIVRYSDSNASDTITAEVG